MLKTAWEKTGHLLIIVGVIVSMWQVGRGAWGGSIATRWYWMMGIMLGFILFLGLTVNGRFDGALIDWRNKMSLSHLQVILWTILGMSAFLTIGLARIADRDKMIYEPLTAFEQAKAVGNVNCLENVAEKDITVETLAECPEPEPLNVVFPEELLLAMGISLASFAGSSLVKNNQATTTLLSADEERNLQTQIEKERQGKISALAKVDELNTNIQNQEMKKIEAEQAGRKEEVESAGVSIEFLKGQLKEHQTKAETANNKIAEKEKELEKLRKDREESKGLLHVRKTPQDAQWSDMFKKEIASESNLIDLSKIQMFFFTFSVIFAYAATLNDLMQKPDLINNPFGVTLPAFSASLVVLLGVSHGGYLVTKTTDTASVNAKKQ